MKRLEKGRSVWPATKDGKVHVTAAQLSMLLAPLGSMLCMRLPGDEALTGGHRNEHGGQRSPGKSIKYGILACFPSRLRARAGINDPCARSSNPGPKTPAELRAVSELLAAEIKSQAYQIETL